MTLEEAMAIAEKEEARAKKRKSRLSPEALKNWEDRLASQAAVMVNPKQQRAGKKNLYKNGKNKS